ncbi:MAG: response regulator [Myxococcaceae bacterium]|nr:response regulator [Myxococcaceae bacterium]
MKRRLLVIDDDPAVLQCIAAALRDFIDAELVLASNGREGIAKLREGRFDVIFSDLILSDTSGEKVVEVAHELWPDTPVVMVTGVPEYLPTSDVWPDFILGKPFRFDALNKVLQDALARSGTGAVA